MKKKLLLMSFLAALLLVAGCGEGQTEENSAPEQNIVDTLMEKVNPDALKEKIDVEAIAEKIDLEGLMAKLDLEGLIEKVKSADLMGKIEGLELFDGVESFELGGVQLWGADLPPVKNGDDIAYDLPDALGAITIDNVALPCGVKHLAVLERETDTTRRTDKVRCRVVLESDGIAADYFCTVRYNYTKNGGWVLDDWELDSEGLTVSISEQVLLEQVAAYNISLLEAQYGEGTVNYVSGTWDETSRTSTQTFHVEGNNGILRNQGDVTVKRRLDSETEDGLRYEWVNTGMTNSVIQGADLQGTTWVCTGSVDGKIGTVVMTVSDFQMTAGTVTCTGVVDVRDENGNLLTQKAFYDQRVNWDAVSNDVVQFSIKSGGYIWDFCFGKDEQWMRMNNSYLADLTETKLPEDGNLYALVNSEVTAYTSRLGYSAAKGGMVYESEIGNTIYSQQVTYPTFTGTGADWLNQLLQDKMAEFYNSPSISVEQSALNEMEAIARERGVKLPITDKLDISLEFNKNMYVSLLFTMEREDPETGEIVRTCWGEIYDLSTCVEKSYDLFVDSTSAQKTGALLAKYGGESFPYTEATAVSYVEAVTLGPQGYNYYLSREGKSHIKITIPYSEDVSIWNPNWTRDL